MGGRIPGGRGRVGIGERGEVRGSASSACHMKGGEGWHLEVELEPPCLALVKQEELEL